MPSDAPTTESLASANISAFSLEAKNANPFGDDDASYRLYDAAKRFPFLVTNAERAILGLPEYKDDPP